MVTLMPQPERFDILVLGSGKSGKLLAWHMAQSGRRTAVVERQWIGGSCPNIACLPSKNEIWSARVAHLAREGARFGVVTGNVTTDMATVRQRKRDMVNREIAAHLQNYKATGAELIMGTGRFVAPRTLEVQLNDGRDASSVRRSPFSQPRNARSNPAYSRSRSQPAAHPR
jgi:pyruvate/2-oxoglutarate dehydrogenase complex dihydrolipoamide dehydrogenase (E3) component